ncbi:MAG TPA: DNA adenine methylase [Methylophilaceae bacterium]|jgi:DNA adenine methylase
MSSHVKTPFRYPGSKSAFTNVVKEFVDYNGLKDSILVEPYAGSAAVTISLISENICSNAVIGERDPLLYSFWKVVFTNPKELKERIRLTKVDLDTWESLQPFLKIDNPRGHDLDELAFAAIFLNRTNFSGVMHAGPIGGKSQRSAYKVNCRFNKDDLISKITQLRKLGSRVKVKFGDALKLIDEYRNDKNCLFYIDPPYFIQGPKLYRHHYSLTQHIALAKALESVEFKWLLSYDSHDVIKRLYEEHNHVLKPFQYSTRTPKNENELLITNLLIPDSE